MNKQELIKHFEDMPYVSVVQMGKKSFINMIEKLDEPQPIKLKDVIARIKGFELDTQKVWLNEILNELGSDYGTLKYKAGYEQGKLEGEWVGQQLKDADKIRQELNKPVVPQIVADYIKDAKYYEWDLDEVFDHIADESGESEISKRFYTLGNIDVFARAWLDGYTVEEEKRYKVRVKGVYFNTCLIFEKENKKWLFSSFFEIDHQRIHHTRKELEEAGFGWVFDCLGIEIEEVE